MAVKAQYTKEPTNNFNISPNNDILLILSTYLIHSNIIPPIKINGISSLNISFILTNFLHRNICTINPNISADTEPTTAPKTPINGIKDTLRIKLIIALNIIHILNCLSI